MIKVLGRFSSVNVQTVRWALEELGLNYTQTDIGGSFGGNDTPEYLAMNPNGLVPVMIDGDLTLFESTAIVRYLSAKYGHESFYPSSPEDRAKLDMWAEWMRTSFYPILIGRIFYPLVRHDPSTWNEAELKLAYDDMAKAASILDQRLSDGPYINGDHLSFADIIIGALLFRYYDLDFARSNTPNLDKYYQALQDRPKFVEHIMVSYESLRWSPSD